MSSLPRCHSVEFPRPKIYLEHLSCLIEKIPTVQPEVQINKKLFPQRSFAKKLSLQTQRAKSNIQIKVKKYDLEPSPRKTAPSKSPMKGQPSTTRGTLFRSGGSEQLQVRNGYFGSENTQYSPNKWQTSTTRSQQFARVERVDLPRKQFLRKGSNIQKQIVVNILRNKLLKQREERKQKEYSNEDIIKMIQVFKGVDVVESRKGSRRAMTRAEGNTNRSPYRNKDRFNIQGWQQQEPMNEFIMREEPTEPNEKASPK